VIVVLPLPGPDGPAPAPLPPAPIRVTTDATATGVPLFNPATTPPGVYIRWDAWTGADAVFRFAGNCIGCGARTWRHDRGGDDVRGPFGDHTCVEIDEEDLRGQLGDEAEVPDGTSFPRCAVCWNEDRERYQLAMDRAVAAFRKRTPAAEPGTLF
jgi:hypothetical protein